MDGDEKICEWGDRESFRVREVTDTGALAEEVIGGGSCSLSALNPSAHVDEGVRGRPEIEAAVARR